MIAGHASEILADTRLIEAGLRSALVTFGQMLPRESLVLNSQDFIDSSALARSCMQQLCCDGVAVTLSLSGRLSGTFALVLDTRAAQQLVSALVGAEATTLLFNDLARSALKEAGNIIASAFLGALESMCGRGGLPGLPVLDIGLPCYDKRSSTDEKRLMYALPVTLVTGTNSAFTARGGVSISLHGE